MGVQVAKCSKCKSFFDAGKYEVCPYCGTPHNGDGVIKKGTTQGSVQKGSVKTTSIFDADSNVSTDEVKELLSKTTNTEERIPSKTDINDFIQFDDSDLEIGNESISTAEVEKKDLIEADVHKDNTDELYVDNDRVVAETTVENVEESIMILSSDTESKTDKKPDVVNVVKTEAIFGNEEKTPSKEEKEAEEARILEQIDATAILHEMSNENNSGKTVGIFRSNRKPTPAVTSMPQQEQSKPVVNTVKTEQQKTITEKAQVQNVTSAVQPQVKVVTKYIEEPAEPFVGWLVCIKGPAQCKTYKINAGRNSVGRDDSNHIIIRDDMRISRSKHCWVTYEPKKRIFFIQPGDSSGLTYVNDDFITENRTLVAGDKIELGDSLFMLVPLCGESFSWEEYLG